MNTVLEVKISYELETGKILVFAPMNQKDVLYDILKLAKRAIKKFCPPPAMVIPVLDAAGQPMFRKMEIVS